MTKQVNSLVGRLYDAKAEDREVEIRPGMAMPTGNQLLWIDIDRDADQLSRSAQALGLTSELDPLEEPRNQPRLIQAKKFVRISVIGLEAGERVRRSPCPSICWP